MGGQKPSTTCPKGYIPTTLTGFLYQTLGNQHLESVLFLRV
ncbi:hypothetical protein JCM19239_1184 [Vibrio variabilis]|uniref:Uncharacterized protein n=1 Tax=Vibrio variabilis TaxID=990271 RepID=A0ABQ0JAQ1_9VIBR|nr:hypothetical protein JCM19239_1184 [Vibrio variabilis]